MGRGRGSGPRGPYRTDLDGAVLKDLYENKHLSVAALSRKFDASPDTITARLAAAGTTMRPRGPQPAGRPPPSPQETRLMVRLYRKDKWSIHRIGQHLGRHDDTVKKTLTRARVQFRTGRDRQRIRPDLVPATLKRLYEDEGLSVAALAAKFGATAPTILARLREAGTVMRPRGHPVGRKLPPLKPAPRTGKYTLAEVQVNLVRKPMIAARAKVDLSTVYGWIAGHDDFPSAVLPGTRLGGAMYWWPEVQRFMAHHGLPRPQGRAGVAPPARPAGR